MDERLAEVVIGVHHVAIAVPSLAEARVVWVDGVGLEERALEEVPDQRVRVLVCHAGPDRIELVEPAAEDSPISGFLAKRGPGLHHVALRVADIETALDRLKRAGLRLIDESPRLGAEGTRIAFVHPSATGGVLTELVEVPREASGA